MGKTKQERINILCISTYINYNSTAQYNSLLLRLDVNAWSSRGSAFFTSHFRPFTECIRTPSDKSQCTQAGIQYTVSSVITHTK